VRQVFISYSHSDKDLAAELAEFLEGQGVRVFIDTRRVGVGQRITEAIGHGLAGSNYVVLLASPESVTSGWVKAELDTALQLEFAGQALLVVVKVGECTLPLLARGKLYLDIPGEWTNDSLTALLEATQPNIFRNGWPSRVYDFAGAGGAVTENLLEEGFPFYRLRFRLESEGSFAGVCWEPTTGAVDVVNYTHFACKLRSPTESEGTLQLKLETKGGWPLTRIPLPGSVWTETSLALASLAPANWERLERVTAAADDRDLAPRQEHVIDLADLAFFRSGG
jgi:hypothetical protein